MNVKILAAAVMTATVLGAAAPSAQAQVWYMGREGHMMATGNNMVKTDPKPKKAKTQQKPEQKKQTKRTPAPKKETKPQQSEKQASAARRDVWASGALYGGREMKYVTFGETLFKKMQQAARKAAEENAQQKSK